MSTFSNAAEVEPRPGRALVPRPPSRAEPTSTRIGVFFYLVSVGIVGAATLGASLGIGFYLLVHPANEIGSDRFDGRDARPGDDKPAAFAVLPQPAASVAPIPAAPPPIAATGAPPELETQAPVVNASDSQPEAGSSEREASAAIAERNESVLQPPGFGATGEETGTQHEGIQNFTPDPNPAPVIGAQLKDDSAAPPEGPEEHSSGPTGQSTSIRGTVTDVPNVVTWVVDGHTVRLFGIEPGPPKLLASLINWVRARGPVECVPREWSLRYRCFTGSGEDIAEAALLAGIGRTGPEAGAVYRDAELHARRMGKGLWARH